MIRSKKQTLFTRKGTDGNFHDFSHTLVISFEDDKECVFLISKGMDSNGKTFREEWAHSRTAQAVFELLCGNDYLTLAREEVDDQTLPKLGKISPSFAEQVKLLIDEDTFFPGDY